MTVPRETYTEFFVLRTHRLQAAQNGQTTWGRAKPAAKCRSLAPHAKRTLPSPPKTKQHWFVFLVYSEVLLTPVKNVHSDPRRWDKKHSERSAFRESCWCKKVVNLTLHVYTGINQPHSLSTSQFSNSSEGQWLMCSLICSWNMRLDEFSQMTMHRWWRLSHVTCK